jgi:hypothetical protein
MVIRSSRYSFPAEHIVCGTSKSLPKLLPGDKIIRFIGFQTTRTTSSKHGFSGEESG